MMALGTLPVGALAERIGLSWGLALGGIVLMVMIVVLALAAPALRRL